MNPARQHFRTFSASSKEDELQPFLHQVHISMDAMKRRFGKRNTSSLPLPHLFEQNVTEKEREAKRTYQDKPVILPVKHPIFLIIDMVAGKINTLIKNFIDSLLNTSANSRELLFLANSLKNHGFINQKEFLEFKEAHLSSATLEIETLKNMLSILFNQHRIDKKTYRNLLALTLAGQTKNVLHTLFSLSSLSHLHRFEKELKEVLPPKEQLEMMEALKRAYETSQFDQATAERFASVSARVETYHWMKHMGLEGVWRYDHVLQALRSGDEARFAQTMPVFLKNVELRAQEPHRKDFFRQLGASFANQSHKNAFIHFSQGIETQYVLNEWQTRLQDLEAKLLAINGHATAEQMEPILKDLQELYIIFGKVLENEKHSACSQLAFALQQGELQANWQRIGELLHANYPGSLPSHQLCGCVHDLAARAAWPDTENTKVSASKEPALLDRTLPSFAPKKKALVLYCNWGGGHRMSAEAVSSYLGKNGWHTNAIDIPQGAFFPFDPIQKLFGGHNSIATVVNTLTAGSYHFWLAKLRGSGNKKGDVAPQEKEAIVSALKAQILKDRPDMLVSVYGSSHLQYFRIVAKELGIPLVMVGTDMFCSGQNFGNDADQDPHFRFMIPYHLPQVIENCKKDGLNEEQIAPIGYPVRPSFLKERSPEEVQQLKEKHGIAPDKKVLYISFGGCGSFSKIPELLALSKKHSNLHVFVLTGRNEQAKKQLEDFIKENREKLNPTNTIVPLGFVDPSEYLAVSDVVYGKGGGSSVAEWLATKKCMILDPDGPVWEQEAAKEIQKRGLGYIAKNDEEFFTVLDQALTHENIVDPVLHRTDTEKNFVDLVNGMLERANQDPVYQKKREAWQTSTSLTLLPETTPDLSSLTYQQGMGYLQKNLKEIGTQNGLTIEKEIFHALIEGKPVRIDFNTMKLVIAEKYSPKEMRLLVRFLKRSLERAVQEKNVTTTEEHIAIAQHVLQQLTKRYENKMRQQVQKERFDPFFEEIASLDRFVVAVQLKRGKIQPREVSEKFFLDQPHVHHLRNVSHLYTTPLAKASLEKWCGMKTSRGRKEGGYERLMSEKTALLSYLFHPQHYEMIQKLELDKVASRFNHQWKGSDLTGELYMPFQGVPTPFSVIEKKSISMHRGQIMDWAHQKRYHYHFKNGLQPLEKEDRPENWENGIPLFCKEPPRETPALVICTTKERAWIRLKAQDGSVYSVSRQMDLDFSPEWLDSMKAVPGFLTGMDPIEFSGKEKEIKETLIDLTPEKFAEVKNYIETVEAEAKGFNPINVNDASFVKDVARQAGVEVDSQETIAEYLLPTPHVARKTMVEYPLVRRATYILSYPLTLLKNCVYALFLGAMRKEILLSSQRNAEVFPSVRAIFAAEEGHIHSAKVIRIWQEVRAEQQRKNQEIV